MTNAFGPAHIAELRELVDQYLSGLTERRRPTSLYEPIVDVLDSRGKRLRPLLTILAAEAYGVPANTSLPGAAAVEVFHNFTLVHDDIMDGSDTRRGRPTVHVKWGEPAGILAGDFLLGMSYKLLTRLPVSSIGPALNCFSTMVTLLCEGQALDAEFESSVGVTVADYLDMVSKKTGALLVASLQLGGIIGDASTEHLEMLAGVGYHLGQAFQIQDDLLDVTAESSTWGKPVGADLLSGKRTFLLLKAVEFEAATGGGWFRTLMEENGIDISMVPEARRRLAELGVFETARSVILEEYEKSLAVLEILEGEQSFQGVRWIIEEMQTRIK